MNHQSNTRVEYLYRDANNYKTLGSEVLAGSFSNAHLALIEAKLIDGDGFIPSQVGLPDLQSTLASWGDGDLDPQADHAIHEWPAEGSDLTLEPTDDPPTVDISCEQLAHRFASITEWDFSGWDETSIEASNQGVESDDDVICHQCDSRVPEEALEPSPNDAWTIDWTCVVCGYREEHPVR